MVRIRLKRMGRRNRAFFRIEVMDIRTRRDGRTIEHLGHYDPYVADDQTRVVLNKDRAAYWLGVGAQPTESIAAILTAQGVAVPQPKKKEKTWKSKVRRTPKRRLKRRAAEIKAAARALASAADAAKAAAEAPAEQAAAEQAAAEQGAES